MTTPAPVTNPCTQCGEEEAQFSLMSLSDFSQVKLGANCAVVVFRGVADEIEAAGQAAATAETVAELTDPDGDVAAETVPAKQHDDGHTYSDADQVPARQRKTKTAGD